MLFPLIHLRSDEHHTAHATVLSDVSALLRLNAATAKRYGLVSFPVVANLEGHANWHQSLDSTAELVDKRTLPALLVQLDEAENAIREAHRAGYVQELDAADWTRARIVALEAASRSHSAPSIPDSMPF